MSTFAQRMADARAHECAVQTWLLARGWRVTPFGQDAMDADFAGALRRTNHPLRWAPDLLAVRGAKVISVDAKRSFGDGGGHNVEQAAALAHQALALGGLFEETWYVFADRTCCSHITVLATGSIWPGSRAGSGTPYVTVSSRYCEPLDEVFGRVLTASERRGVSWTA